MYCTCEVLCIGLAHSLSSYFDLTTFFDASMTLQITKKCDDKSAHSIDYNNQGFLRSSSGRCNNYFNELHV